MFEKVAEAISAIHRLPTQLLAVAGIAAAVILFIPEHLAATLAVDSFRQTYRTFLGPGLVVVTAWLSWRLLAALSGPLREHLTLQKLKKRLHNLTPEEKGYLATFVLGQNNTIYLPVDDGIIGGLKARGIVYRSSNLFHVLEGVPYNLHPWARDHLSANPELLLGAEGMPRTPRQRYGLR